MGFQLPCLTKANPQVKFKWKTDSCSPMSGSDRANQAVGTPGNHGGSGLQGPGDPCCALGVSSALYVYWCFDFINNLADGLASVLPSCLREQQAGSNE